MRFDYNMLKEGGAWAPKHPPGYATGVFYIAVHFEPNQGKHFKNELQYGKSMRKWDVATWLYVNFFLGFEYEQTSN